MAELRSDPGVLAPETLLTREADQRLRVGMLTLAATVLLVLSALVAGVVASRAPGILLTDGLRETLGETFGNPPRPALLTPIVDYQHSKFALLLLSGVANIAYLGGLAFTLTYLFDASRGRRPETQSWLRSLVLSGIAALAITTLVKVIGQHISLGDFLSSSHQTSKSARDAFGPPAVQIAQFVGDFGSVALSVSWVLICLNAMRAGLLTRFLGTLGIFSGALTFPFLSQLLSGLPIIQIFWLLFVGLTILQRAPSGTPPAWVTGKAEPWPTADEARAARERAATAKDGGEKKPEVVDTPSPATSARKRKRRGT